MTRVYVVRREPFFMGWGIQRGTSAMPDEQKHPTLGSSFQLPRCPWCGISAPNLRVRSLQNGSNSGLHTKDDRGDNARFWKVYSCANCGGLVLVWGEASDAPAWGYLPKGKDVDDQIPERAQHYLRQALETKHAPSASTVMAASAVDAMLKAKKLSDGTLNERIDKAAQDGILTEGMKHWAHQIRLDANAQRHADNTEALPNAKDAENTIDFAFALAEFLFVLPSRVTRGISDAQTPNDAAGTAKK